MQVVGFEDSDQGQRRIVVDDLVGGFKAAEVGEGGEGREMENVPPSGGAGMCVLALWSWWPAEGVSDELAFPRGAEIRQCVDRNGEWFVGVYCGREGLFPAPYGKVVGRIG